MFETFVSAIEQYDVDIKAAVLSFINNLIMGIHIDVLK
jgi:hypothetical protein